MKAVWTQAKSGNWSATFRGISIVIRVNPKTRRPTEIEFFIAGRRVESAPVTCTLEIAKRIAQGKQGRRPGEKESRLYLTGLPRGSFGVVLSQPFSEDLFSAPHINEGMEQLASLVEAAALGDDNFAETVGNFHPRVLKALRRFLYSLAAQDASVTIRAGRKQTALSLMQIQEAHKRTASARVETKKVTIKGVFKGLLLESWRFDFLPENGQLITGLISEDITEDQAKEIERLFDKPSIAELISSFVVTQSGASRSSYILKSLIPA